MRKHSSTDKAAFAVGLATLVAVATAAPRNDYECQTLDQPPGTCREGGDVYCDAAYNNNLVPCDGTHDCEYGLEFMVNLPASMCVPKEGSTCDEDSVGVNCGTKYKGQCKDIGIHQECMCADAQDAMQGNLTVYPCH